MSKLLSGFYLYIWHFVCCIMDILKIFRMQEPVTVVLSKKERICQAKVVLQDKCTINENKKYDHPIGEIFRMQEPVSKGMLSKKEEVGQYKEVLQEKEFLIKNNEERIKELENEICDLKETNHSLECRLKASSLDENGFQEVMLSYDDFFKKIWIEREQVLSKNTVTDTYLQNLEFSYNELLEKFEKAKEIIYGLKNNQDLLKEELEEYKEVIEVWEKRYEGLKVHSETTIAEANKELGDKEKENLQEVSKLKSKILQRQAKIIELEKMLKHDLKPSIYAPLRNRITTK